MKKSKTIAEKKITTETKTTTEMTTKTETKTTESDLWSRSVGIAFTSLFEFFQILAKTLGNASLKLLVTEN